MRPTLVPLADETGRGARAKGRLTEPDSLERSLERGLQHATRPEHPGGRRAGPGVFAVLVPKGRLSRQAEGWKCGRSLLYGPVQRSRLNRFRLPEASKVGEEVLYGLKGGRP